MPKIVFHVSTKQYEPNQVVSVPAGEQTAFHGRLVAANAAGAEQRLEGTRPPAAQSRLTTQYAFDDVFQCLHYGNSEYDGQELHFYRVSMENPTEVPMALVDAIGKFENPTDAQVAAIVAEYWNPTLNWGVLEYLAPSMTVIEKLPKPSDDAMEAFGAGAKYGSDIALAKQVAKAILAGEPLPVQQEEEDHDDDEGVE